MPPRWLILVGNSCVETPVLCGFLCSGRSRLEVGGGLVQGKEVLLCTVLCPSVVVYSCHTFSIRFSYCCNLRVRRGSHVVAAGGCDYGQGWEIVEKSM